MSAAVGICTMFAKLARGWTPFQKSSTNTPKLVPEKHGIFTAMLMKMNILPSSDTESFCSDNPPPYEESQDDEEEEEQLTYGQWLCPHLILTRKELRKMFFNKDDDAGWCDSCTYAYLDKPIWKAADTKRCKNTAKSAYLLEQAEIVHRFNLFSAPSSEELGMCFKEYFSNDRIRTILKDLDIPLCGHLRYNSKFILNTFPGARSLLHPERVLAQNRRINPAHCGWCPGNNELHVKSPVIKCLDRQCTFGFQWGFEDGLSAKTKAKTVRLCFIGRWSLSVLDRNKGEPIWADTTHSWSQSDRERFDRAWQECNSTANDMERRWLSQAPRRENCLLGPGESCLRPPGQDPVFEEPECRH